MPTFETPQEHRDPIKMLYMGHTGEGKTGSLVSLAAAGYNVRILDLDRGVDILRDYVMNKESPYRKARAGLWTQEQADTLPQRLSYITCTEEYTIMGAKPVPRATAWNRAQQILNSWTDGDLKLGNVGTWTDRDVLVIDSFSRLCEAAMNIQLAMNNRLQSGPQVGTSGTNDYTAMNQLVTQWLDFIKCDAIRCNVIMICHIQFIGEPQGGSRSGAQQGDLKGFPQTVGRMIAPKVGQYFNHSLRAKSYGTGPSVRRVIVTNNDENVALKNTAPLKVKEQYPLETGLAEYFQALRGPLP